MKHEVAQSMRNLVVAPGNSETVTVTAEFRFDAGLTIFAGHFPGLPIVPGVFLVEIGRVLSERAVDRRLRIEEIAKARFTAEVPPGVNVTAQAEVLQAGGEYVSDIVITVDDEVAAKLRLKLREAAAGSTESRTENHP